MTYSQMAAIAARYDTSMSRAMEAALRRIGAITAPLPRRNKRAAKPRPPKRRIDRRDITECMFQHHGVDGL